VILSEAAADFFNASAGDQVTITLEDGTNGAFRVAGVVSNSLGPGDVVFPLPVAANHGAQPLADSVFLKAVPGEDVEALRQRLSGEFPNVAFMTQADYVDTVEQSAIDGQWVLYLIIGLAVAFAALSVINTMVMAISDRRREFALLRLIGATERQIRTMILGEASIVLVIGVIAGGVSALLSMISVSQALVGNTSALTVPPVLSIATVVVAVAIAVTAHVLPATSALRLNPVEQIGMRE
jgi:putative ABC transport system permease protein